MSQLVEVRGFYNISNICESLLNVANLRLGLWKRIISLSGHKIDLFNVLDEIALNACVSPKMCIKDIRAYLTMVIRFSGVRNPNSHHLRTRWYYL